MQPQQTPPIPEPALPPVPGMPVSQGTTPVAPAVPAAPVGNTPELADDGDLIEKDWVNKVKQIITATAQDPFEQSRQFSLLKADYLQKRYGKTIKAKDS